MERRKATRQPMPLLVTASVARQSMPSEVMDCFTAFAMTDVTKSVCQSLNTGARLPMLAIMASCRSLLSSMAAFQVAT